MRTSYYSKSANNPNAISIAGSSPKWYKGKEYKKLAPNYWFFKKYKDDGDEEFYKKQYYSEILDKLDAQETYDELGEDAILLCWEGSDKFCHRHIVSEWFAIELEKKVEEVE